MTPSNPVGGTLVGRVARDISACLKHCSQRRRRRHLRRHLRRHHLRRRWCCTASDANHVGFDCTFGDAGRFPVVLAAAAAVVGRMATRCFCPIALAATS